MLFIKSLLNGDLLNMPFQRIVKGDNLKEITVNDVADERSLYLIPEVVTSGH